jgi:hypothetical protein
MPNQRWLDRAKLSSRSVVEVVAAPARAVSRWVRRPAFRTADGRFMIAVIQFM